MKKLCSLIFCIGLIVLVFCANSQRMRGKKSHFTHNQRHNRWQTKTRSPYGSSYSGYDRHFYSRDFLDSFPKNHSRRHFRSGRSFSRANHGFRERCDYYNFGGLDLGGDAWGWGWWSPVAPYGAIGVGVGYQKGQRATPYTWGGVGYVPLY